MAGGEASAGWAGRLIGALVMVHRYLGVGVGLIMTLWCLSGFVMIYSGYPHVTQAQRQGGLAPLRLETCCAALPALVGARAAGGGFEIEMLAGRPVLRLSDGGPSIDLKTGAPAPAVDAASAQGVAELFAHGVGLGGRVRGLALIDKDQWTVEGAARRGPVYRVVFDDPRASVVYVARRTGEVVQATTRGQRFWGWLGAVPHWLYPTLLRQDGRLWTQVVIWTSLAGVFLTATGLYVGITRLGRRRSGRWSPYRGVFYWHHLLGLVFGLLTLAWVGSGLLSVNPWGLLDSSPGEVEQSRLAGSVDPADLARLVAALPKARLDGVVALRTAPLGGRLFVMAAGADGRSQRLDAGGIPTPLDGAQLALLVQSRLGGAPSDPVLITRPDAYDYASYDGPADLPALRVALRDSAHTTLYLDPTSGEVMRAVDDTQRLSRWTRTALHDWDFIRARPLWDVLVLVLLTGVTCLCALGTWLGIQRARQDWTALRRRS